MALITWQDLLDRASRTTGESPIIANSIEYKKAFDYYINKWRSGDTHQKIQYKNLPKKAQLSRIINLIQLNLKANKGKFAPGIGYKSINIDPKLKWDVLVKKPGFKNEFESYLKRSESAGVQAIAKKKIPLKDKYNALDHWQKTTARKAVDAKLVRGGRISMSEFAPLTNFKRQHLLQMINMWDKPFPKLKADGSNLREIQLIARAKDFKEFFKDNNIEVFRKPKYVTKKPGLIKGDERAGNIFFTDVTKNKAKLKALTGFLNLGQIPSSKIRNQAVQLSKDHPLYEDTGRNFRKFLEAAKKNINTTIEGYNDKGLRKFLTEHPKLFKNATAMFDSGRGRIIYADINKLKEMDLSKLRQNLKLEVEHNRAIGDYWKNLTKDGKINAKNRLLFDAEFGHNLSLDTGQYNKSLKRNLTSWIESPLNAHKTTQIDALSKEMANLGHRFYAGGKWRGREIEIKPGYRDTVVNSWRQAIQRSTGLKWSELLKDRTLANSLTKAMEDVALNPKQLRMIGDMFGCPRTFKSYEEGGRVRLQAGGQGLEACVSTKLKQPGAMEKIAALPEEVGGALGKLKNISRGFLGALGRFGPTAGKYGAIAALGAVAQPLVKQFMNDDPFTYLTDPDQQAGMLEALIEGERPKPPSEILDWGSTAGMVGATAATVPGTGAMYKYRRGLLEKKIPKAGPFTEKGIGPGSTTIGPRGKGYGVPRAAMGPIMKYISGMYTPAGLLAHEPLRIAQMRREGESWGEIAKSPTLWMGPAFADTMTKIATAGMKPGSKLARALSLGMSRPMLKTVSRRFGMPGLALSAGLSGYDLWKDYKKKRGFFARDEE